MDILRYNHNDINYMTIKSLLIFVAATNDRSGTKLPGMGQCHLDTSASLYDSIVEFFFLS